MGLGKVWFLQLARFEAFRWTVAFDTRMPAEISNLRRHCGFFPHRNIFSAAISEVANADVNSGTCSCLLVQPCDRDTCNGHASQCQWLCTQMDCQRRKGFQDHQSQHTGRFAAWRVVWKQNLYSSELPSNSELKARCGKYCSTREIACNKKLFNQTYIKASAQSVSERSSLAGL